MLKIGNYRNNFTLLTVYSIARSGIGILTLHHIDLVVNTPAEVQTQ